MADYGENAERGRVRSGLRKENLRSEPAQDPLAIERRLQAVTPGTHPERKTETISPNDRRNPIKAGLVADKEDAPGNPGRVTKPDEKIRRIYLIIA